MKIYNTLTRQKEEFVPIEPGKVRLYACGPTVYSFFHIGNARQLIIFDVLRRYLEYIGYDVTFVQNFTDVDDKIINKANEEGVSSEAIAARFIDEYWTDANGLGVRPATIHPKATETMDGIIDMIAALVEKGFAYEAKGDVYYRARKFEGYGKLSRQNLEDLEAGARIATGDIKEDPMDFALWKAAKPGEPSWPSPWSDGRPGWHIECSAMAKRHLGETIDIHGGGVDLCFPHHENEIAQSEAANGKPFANYWMHNAFINIDHQKMSKSKGNFFTTRDAAAAYGYDAIRFFMLSAHYRSPINYSTDVLVQSQAALSRLYTALDNLDFLLANGSEGDMNPREQESKEGFGEYERRFREAMEDDLNTAEAIGVIFELVRDVNTAGTQGSRAYAAQAKEALLRLCDILGIGRREEGAGLESEIEAMIEARQQARKDKNFGEADRIRDELKARGILLEDTPQGVKWHRE